MTLPFADERHVVLAESLQESLNLGFAAGWFSLEQLVYSPSEAIEYFANPDPEQVSYAGPYLAFIPEAMTLRFVPPSLERLLFLKQRYGDLLK